MSWLVMPSKGCCQSAAFSATGASSGPVAIDKPVGAGARARNLAEDVKTIQDAINQVTVKGAAGGSMPFLTVDGFCGPKTNAAIIRFQRAQIGSADGLVEPNKKTVAKLNDIIDGVSEDDLRAKLRLAVPIVGQSIAAALSNLMAVISGAPDANVQSITAADRLNRHFRIESLPSTDQSTARVALFSTYTRLNAVITSPELFNIETADEFDLDKGNPKKALVQRKGFFKPGQEADGRRLDRIHLGLGFFARTVTPEFGAFIILHELSHFVGRADGVEIEDFGRGWFDDAFIRPLPASKRLANADSYATFAHECRVQSSVKPGFVQGAPGGLGGAR